MKESEKLKVLKKSAFKQEEFTLILRLIELEEIVLFKKLEKKNPREKMLIQSFYTFINSILKYPEQKDILINTFQKDLKSISINNRAYLSFISFDYNQRSLKLKAKLSICKR